MSSRSAASSAFSVFPRVFRPSAPAHDPAAREPGEREAEARDVRVLRGLR